jgi:poly-gamma-glutamate capsule biosynthesis protein CapA/YwtB (metallophosphatase superfamily)
MWTRRRFLRFSSYTLAAAGTGSGLPGIGELAVESRSNPTPFETAGSATIQLFFCGDVMTGRGIDQILPHPSKPRIYEPAVSSALGYVGLAERANGPIPYPVDFSYVWGDALAELRARAPDRRIVNLETSITTSEEALPKGINYRMHPRNVPCLQAASIDCCVLANNHVLDWGTPGLLETVESLRRAGISATGAGRNAGEAERPAVLDAGKGRVLVFGFGSPTSGVPIDWSATQGRPGVQVLPDLSAQTASRVADRIYAQRRPGDLVVASIHWGGNWGYEIPRAQREFAHRLVDSGSVDVVHGHSSHHPKGIEVYRSRPILYGSGDFVNDYEGIEGHERYRSELVLAYFVTLAAVSGTLQRLEMVPFRTVRFRLQRASRKEASWLQGVLEREGRDLGTDVDLTPKDALALRW